MYVFLSKYEFFDYGYVSLQPLRHFHVPIKWMNNTMVAKSGCEKYSFFAFMCSTPCPLPCDHERVLAEVEALNRGQRGPEPVLLDVGGVRYHVAGEAGASIHIQNVCLVCLKIHGCVYPNPFFLFFCVKTEGFSDTLIIVIR